MQGSLDLLKINDLDPQGRTYITLKCWSWGNAVLCGAVQITISVFFWFLQQIYLF